MIRNDLVRGDSDPVARYRESDPGVGTARRDDGGIHPDQSSPGIQQGSSRIAGIDGGVGLDDPADRRTSSSVVVDAALHLAIEGRDDSRCYGSIESEGIADGDETLSDQEGRGWTVGDGREGFVYFSSSSSVAFIAVGGGGAGDDLEDRHVEVGTHSRDVALAILGRRIDADIDRRSGRRLFPVLRPFLLHPQSRPGTIRQGVDESVVPRGIPQRSEEEFGRVRHESVHLVVVPAQGGVGAMSLSNDVIVRHEVSVLGHHEAGAGSEGGTLRTDEIPSASPTSSLLIRRSFVLIVVVAAAVPSAEDARSTTAPPTPPPPPPVVHHRCDVRHARSARPKDVDRGALLGGQVGVEFGRSHGERRIPRGLFLVVIIVVIVGSLGEEGPRSVDEGAGYGRHERGCRRQRRRRQRGRMKERPRLLGRREEERKEEDGAEGPTRSAHRDGMIDDDDDARSTRRSRYARFFSPPRRTNAHGEQIYRISDKRRVGSALCDASDYVTRLID
mmetsp:Transcript_49370/g.148690  ORF Transcript_49370/g.148690 Transcript_49370/m.148690 type:complete len:502 (-) Transcript_49370:356-1861(-)